MNRVGKMRDRLERWGFLVGLGLWGRPPALALRVCCYHKDRTRYARLRDRRVA